MSETPLVKTSDIVGWIQFKLDTMPDLSRERVSRMLVEHGIPGVMEEAIKESQPFSFFGREKRLKEKSKSAFEGMVDLTLAYSLKQRNTYADAMNAALAGQFQPAREVIQDILDDLTKSDTANKLMYLERIKELRRILKAIDTHSVIADSAT